MWERYGFRGDPFETGPLPVNFGQGISVGTAYVERGGPMNPGAVLTNFLRNPGGGRIAVEGEPGVGKTTFVNFHRYEWGTEAKPPLLSPVAEIEVRHGWGEIDFLVNLLAALSARIRLEMKTDAIEKDSLLTKISAITGVHTEKDGGFGFNLSVLGSGFGVSKSGKSNYVAGSMTAMDLRILLAELIAKAKRDLGCGGIIFHLDNLELLKRRDETDLLHFFDDIRDTLQLRDVYFIFVGYRGMFQDVIAPNPRVRSIFFDKPLYLKPLSLPQVHEIIQRRYDLLAAPGKTIIKPVEDAVVDYLYQVFDAKLRPIMNAVTSLVSHMPESVAETLNLDDATGLLRAILWSEVEAQLGAADQEVFRAAARLRRFTPTALGREVGKYKQQIAKHLNRLLELRYIHLAEKRGRSRYYEVDARFHVLESDGETDL